MVKYAPHFDGIIKETLSEIKCSSKALQVDEDGMDGMEMGGTFFKKLDVGRLNQVKIRFGRVSTDV